jgi:peptidyl-tRNA hydrolase, PTH1 family
MFFCNMIIIYGLGNNDEKYLNTKHNIGRIIAEKWSNQLSEDSFKKVGGCSVKKCVTNSQTIYFAYSNGFMNESGKALLDFIQYMKSFSIDTQLLIIQDDSDQPEGSWKLAQGGGSAGHRGIDSIYNHSLGMEVDGSNIWRLKIGIRPPENKEKSETFVLKPITKLDVTAIENILAACISNMKFISAKNWPAFQNFINTKNS